MNLSELCGLSLVTFKVVARVFGPPDFASLKFNSGMPWLKRFMSCIDPDWIASIKHTLEGVAQSADRKALNLDVVGSSPSVGF